MQIQKCCLTFHPWNMSRKFNWFLTVVCNTLVYSLQTYKCTSQQDRQHCRVDVFGEMNYNKLTTSDNFWIFFLMDIILWPSDDCCDDLWILLMTLYVNDRDDNHYDLLTTLTMSGEDLLVTCDDDTTDPCDDTYLWSQLDDVVIVFIRDRCILIWVDRVYYFYDNYS